MKAIRSFFDARHFLEVETPILGKTATSEPFIDAMRVGEYYLQTSPEYAMKRLIAAGVGDCYSITKVFREAESGSRHNPEFTMLEWYRVDWDHHQLIEEVIALLQSLDLVSTHQVHTYKEIFQTHCLFDPHDMSTSDLMAYAQSQQIASNELNLSKDGWLDLIFSLLIMPKLGQHHCADVIIEYPASQAALSKTRTDTDGHVVAERFEVFVEGLELANGYHECQGTSEHQKRYQQDLTIRQSLDKPCPPPDDKFFAAMAHLPASAGVAMGLDRVLMLKCGLKHIQEILSFDFESI